MENTKPQRQTSNGPILEKSRHHIIKTLDRIGLACLLAGFPTAMALFVLSDPTCWNTTRGKVSSVFFLATGMITAIPFGLGFAWFSFEDWRDDRNAKAWNKGE